MLKSYIISLAVGLLAGVIYALINVNSPAPPVMALLGLFGMLVGSSWFRWRRVCAAASPSR